MIAVCKMRWYFLSLLMITHIFVDVGSCILAPLLKRLGVHHQASDVAMGVVLAVFLGSISFSQPLFGYIYDRLRCYWLMPASVLVLGSFVGFIGLVDSFWLLVVVVIIGGLASGAFHPLGTAMAGGLSEKRRPLIIAIFIFGGSLGVGGGPFLISRLVNAQGLGATAWMLAIMIPVLVISLLGIVSYRKLPHSKSPGSHDGSKVGGGIFSRSLLLLFGVAASRSFSIVVCGTGMSFLMAERIPEASSALLSTGNAAGLLGLALGFGGLLSGFFVGAENEKRGIIISLVISGPLLSVFPMVSGGWLVVVLVLGCVALSSTIPLVIAIGQRLLPHSSAVASSIFMGLAWGGAAVVAPIAVTWLGSWVGYGQAMPMLIGGGLLVSLGCTLALPRVIRRTEDLRVVASETVV